MREFVLRVIINAIAIAITASLLPGIHVINDEIGTMLLLGLIFGVINALIRPLLVLLTCPMIVLSLGLFVLVINGCMLSLVAGISGSLLSIDNFGWAILGGVIMAIVGMVLESVLGVRDRQHPHIQFKTRIEDD